MRNQRFKQQFYALITVVLLLFVITVAGLADAGNFSGDSDYGGGGGGGGGSSSSWSSDSDYSSGGDGLPIDSPVLIIIILMFFAIIILPKLISSKKSRVSMHTPAYAPPAKPADISALIAKDPYFSQQAFLEKVSNMYVQLQDAWEHKKWEPIRILMTDALFNQFLRQLNEYIENEQTNHVDRISVLSAVITGYSQDEVNDILTVQLQTRIVDYVTDDKNGALIRGSKTTERFMTYEWTLIRRQGVSSNLPDGFTQTSCKGCGAPLSINQSGQCQYCNAIMSSGEYDWIISAIRGLAQRSGS